MDLKARLKQLGIKQKTFAQLIGRTPQQVSAWQGNFPAWVELAMDGLQYGPLGKAVDMAEREVIFLSTIEAVQHAWNSSADDWDMLGRIEYDLHEDVRFVPADGEWVMERFSEKENIWHVALANLTHKDIATVISLKYRA